MTPSSPHERHEQRFTRLGYTSKYSRPLPHRRHNPTAPQQFSATGSLSAVIRQGYTRTAAPAMVGTVSASVVKTSDSVSAALSTIGSLTASAVKTSDSVTASLTGTGTLTGILSEGYTRTAAPAMTGTLTGTVAVQRAASLSVTGTLTASAHQTSLAAKAATLHDTFATQDATKWYWGGTYSATGGLLQITTTQNAVHGPDSYDTFDLTNSYVSIRIQGFTADTGYTNYVCLIAAQGDNETNAERFYVQQSGGTTNLICEELVGGVPDDTTVTYDSNVHKYLRIRESGGYIFWDTSDGLTWTNQRTKLQSWSVDTCASAVVHIFSYSTAPSPATQYLDDYNAQRAALSATGTLSASTSQLLDLVDIRSYGAVVNGSTNDTTAVQAAANAAVGKTLYFPSGTCRVSTVTIPSGANVIGDGTTSIIKQVTLTTGWDPSPVFDMLGTNTVSNIKIDGNRVANIAGAWSDSYCDAGRGYKNSSSGGRGRGYRCGIRAESTSDITIDNCEITACAGACIATNMCSNLTITNNNLHDNDFEGIYIYGDGYPIVTESGTNVNISNNTINNMHAPTAAGSTQPDAIVVSRVVTVTVDSNVVQNYDRCWLKAEGNHYLTISNNTGGGGVIGYPALQICPNTSSITTNFVRVTGNTITGPHQETAIQLNSWTGTTNVTTDIEVDHNTITGDADMSYGVLMDGLDGLTRINVHDNDINSTTDAAIYVNGGGTGLTLTNNRHNGVTMTNMSIPGTFTYSIGYLN